MYVVFFPVRRDDLGGVNLFPFDPQQLVSGDAENLRQLRQCADVRAGLVRFPKLRIWIQVNQFCR